MIGIGITVHNRNSIAYETISRWQEYLEFLPQGSFLVVVDDASTVPIIGSDYRFTQNVGIATAKNKCLELLKDCEHIFLSDDDCYPIREDWFVPYINSGIKHLSFTFNKLKSGTSNGNTFVQNYQGFIEYMNPCGCMLYIHKDCLEAAGGFDDGYAVYGSEHVDYSRRLFNMGITPRPFLDIPNSLYYFVSLDHQQAIASSVPDRHKYQNANRGRYRRRLGCKDFIPFIKETKYHGGDVVLTSYFNYTQDSQRRKVWSSDTSSIKPLIESLNGRKLKVFHNCFEEENTENIEFIKVEPSNSHNPNVYRWLVYKEYLFHNRFDKVWMVDATDVQMQFDPFDMKPDLIYCGNEYNMKVDNLWMKNTQERFVRMTDYRSVINSNAQKVLINCGLVGGCYDVVMELLFKWASVHSANTAGLMHSTDMAVFNYVMWKHFSDRMVTGEQINTRFKRFEQNSISWWRHK